MTQVVVGRHGRTARTAPAALARVMLTAAAIFLGAACSSDSTAERDAPQADTTGGAAQATDLPTLAEPGAAPIEVLVLGVFHFHNPNADYAQFEGIDVLDTERQEEIAGVVDALARFEPTVIALERPTDEAQELNSDYAAYRNGSFELTANETHQLGFRLAERSDLDRVDPVDFQMGMAFDSMFAYAGEHDPGFISRFDAYIGEIVELMNRMQSEETIAANLRFMNQPEVVRRTNEPYAVQATLGAGDGFVGARTVASWYERNLRIFANLAAAAEPGDRVLLIIGAGHTPIIRHLVGSHPSMRLVEVLDYLP